MSSDSNWKQEKAWRIRYESEHQDLHVVWSNRDKWANVPSIRSFPGSYAEWTAKIAPAQTQHRDPRDILVTHSEPGDAMDLPKQNWQWEQELVWREKHDREKNTFFRWKDFDYWIPHSPWPEYYKDWAPHAHKNHY